MRFAAALLLTSCGFVLAATDSSGAPFAPRTRYDESHSFRGLAESNLTVENYDASGHTSTVSGVHDYLRLVPALPSAYGALFSHQPIQFDEWVVEIAFRVHGHHFTGLGDENGPAFDKGGRGLAFWYTKTANPTQITLTSDHKRQVSPAPPVVPVPSDPTDESVSLFGYKTSFDGLGVVFDTSPQHPLVRRSSAENWEQSRGAKAAGVVAGIIDDGSTKLSWLDNEGRAMAPADEAAYLERAIGECEAGFRNANGLLWARISYVKGTIRVDLDLSPHTTLSQRGRDYAHNCFSLSGVKLEKGYYLGLSALAAGNSEPDAVDVYAMDVFEVVEDFEPVSLKDRAPEPTDKHALEGTEENESVTFAHEIFLSQARLIEAVDALSRRVEGMSPADSASTGGIPATAIIDRLNNLDARISALAGIDIASRTTDDSSSTESLQHLVQLNDRLLAEVKSTARKVESLASQMGGITTQLAARGTENARYYDELDAKLVELRKQLASRGNSMQLPIWGALLVVAAFAFSLVRQRSGSWSDRSKKMI